VIEENPGRIALAAAAVIISAMICTTVAGIKNRNWIGWYLAGAVVPILSVICICLLPRVDHFGRHVR
jgi:hypothetical protein